MITILTTPEMHVLKNERPNASKILHYHNYSTHQQFLCGHALFREWKRGALSWRTGKFLSPVKSTTLGDGKVAMRSTHCVLDTHSARLWCHYITCGILGS